MAEGLDYIKQEFAKAASIPEEGPKWGTPPATDLPGAAKPEGLDENVPVGDDAQNKRYLETNFEQAGAAEEQMRTSLSGNLSNFGSPARISHSQLIKNNPKTNTRVFSAMAGALRSKLGV
jgi:hypothetical protein